MRWGRLKCGRRGDQGPADLRDGRSRTRVLRRSDALRFVLPTPRVRAVEVHRRRVRVTDIEVLERAAVSQ